MFRIFLILLLSCWAPVTWAFSVEHLTVNGRTNPLGIATNDVSLAWSIKTEQRGTVQDAYQIRIGTNEGGSDVWDSGHVASDRQIDIVLPDSLHLVAATRYYWQVKIWDGNGIASDWSAPAWFETGLLSPADWSGAKWIASPTQRSAPNLNKWSDYTVTVRFSLRAVAFGVFLRATPDSQNGYMEQINVADDTPIFKPHKKVHGDYQELARIDLSRFGFSKQSLMNGQHTLVFHVRGMMIETILDGKVIEIRPDASFRSGVIGFRTFGDESATVHSVRVTDLKGRVLMDSDFENGEMDFTGGVVSNGVYEISGNTEAVFSGTSASLPLFHGIFGVLKQVKSARIYASAHGVYQLSINGKKVGDAFLAPGWTDYAKRIQSQTYDVTSLLRDGVNVIGAALGDGWYRGYVGLHWNDVYGDTLGFVAKLHVLYTDGTSDDFVTDDSWRCAEGPFVQADLQNGESYDAQREQQAWDDVGFDASNWTPVNIASADLTKLVPQPDEPVRGVQVLSAKKLTEPEPGKYVYDLGQNMVGVGRIRLTGKVGQTIRIRYAEELYRTGSKQGCIYTDNLRTAKATDTYTFGRDGTVVYQPTFTQHGFRYIQITGMDKAPAIGDVQGVVLGSDMPDIGDLGLSNPMLNQLVSNIRWGERGNFLSIPTDTPARDERMGWTGDINVFSPTACRYRDTRAFLSKWMDDLRDSQKDNGNIPAVAPQPRHEFDETGVGWSDAFITVPYAVWRASGDTQIIRKNWDAMVRFYRFVHDSATQDGNLLEEGRSSWFSGDWLHLEQVNRLDEHRVIATAYFAEDTRMMGEMAAAMGQTNQAAKWLSLVPKIREAFVGAYRNADGSIYTGTQTAYAMALGMDMIADPAQRRQTAGKFVEKLASDNYHLRTGFLGTPWLLPALSKIGREDLAMRLLLNEDYPSWGYEIRMGATTMWERWNSIQTNGEFGPVDMNSFNHYAYGAVGDWMYQHLGGLQILEPGFNKFRINPSIGAGGLTHAGCNVQTCYGLAGSAWNLANDKLTLTAIVPANTTAEIVIPASNSQAVIEGNTSAVLAVGVKQAIFKDRQLILTVGSGKYNFTVQNGH